jgi:hypothetical protein
MANAVLLITAFIFFTIAALIAGGVVTGSLPWLVPGGLAAFVLAMLVPVAVNYGTTRRVA